MDSQIVRTLMTGTATIVLASGLGILNSQPAQACDVEPYLGAVCVFANNFCPRGFAEANGQLMAISSNTPLFALYGTTYGGDGQTTFGLPDLRGRAPVGRAPDGVPATGITPVQLGQARGAEGVTLTSSQVPLPAHNHTAQFQPQTGTSQITIPAQTGSGTTLSGTGTIAMVPGIPAGSPATNNPVSGTSYYLTGLKATGTPVGPYTTAAPSSDATKLVGVNVSVDASQFVSSSPAKQVDVTTVTGGSVTILPAQSVAGAPVATVPPEMALTYCIATAGVYPSRP